MCFRAAACLGLLCHGVAFGGAQPESNAECSWQEGVERELQAEGPARCTQEGHWSMLQQSLALVGHVATDKEPKHHVTAARKATLAENHPTSQPAGSKQIVAQLVAPTHGQEQEKGGHTHPKLLQLGASEVARSRSVRLRLQGFWSKSCFQDPFTSINDAIAWMLVIIVAASLGIWAITVFAARLAQAAPNHNETPGSEVTDGGAGQGKPKAPHMPAIDGVRVILISLIIMTHHGVHTPLESLHLLNSGISIFYFMGGFVAYCATEHRFATFDGVSGLSLIARRLVRLCPGYWAALLWMALLSWSGKLSWGPAKRFAQLPYLTWPVQATLMQGLFPEEICALPPDTDSRRLLPIGGNPVGWFTSALLLCCLCHPFLYNLQNTRLRSGAAKLCAFALILAVRVTKPDPAVEGGWNTYSLTGMENHVNALYRIPEFFGGMLTAQICCEAPAALMQWWGWDYVCEALGWVWLPLPLIVGERFMDIFCVIPLSAVGCVAVRVLSSRPRVWNPTWLRIYEFKPFVRISIFSFGAFSYQMPVSFTYMGLIGLNIKQRLDEMDVGASPTWLAISPLLHQQYWVMPLILTWMTGILSAMLLEGPLIKLSERYLKASEAKAKGEVKNLDGKSTKLGGH